MSDQDRFWAKVHKTETCWLWTSAIDSAGYGRFWYRGNMRLAHKISFEWEKNLILPKHLCVLHGSTCLPSCVNPSHLRAGTHAENMADLARAGNTKSRKVNFEEARELRKKGYSLQVVADYFGSSKQAVKQGLERHYGTSNFPKIPASGD